MDDFWKNSAWVRGYGWGGGIGGGIVISANDSLGNSYQFDEAYTVTFHYKATPTGMPSPGGATPASFALHQNYPNPFNPSTTIRCAVPHQSHVELTVFNNLGQRVATLVNGEVEAGYHEMQFASGGLSTGVYFYRLRAGAYVQTRSMPLIR